jgi:hypothetical protein
MDSDSGYPFNVDSHYSANNCRTESDIKTRLGSDEKISPHLQLAAVAARIRISLNITVLILRRLKKQGMSRREKTGDCAGEHHFATNRQKCFSLAATKLG